MLKKMSQVGSLFLIVAIATGATDRVGSPRGLTFDFSAFDETEWIKARDPAVKEIGHFVQKEGYIQNCVKKEHAGKHSLEAGHVLRLLKDCSFENGRVETELMLVGKAAPSIYFRTQLEGEIHKATYNLVVFDFSTPENKNYHGLNLWKWQKKWIKLASWAFPVPLDKKIKIAVEADGPYIKVFFNDKLKGTVYDSEPLGKGHVGLCSCEGANNFYNFKVIDIR
jgi:hypothetical protein